MKSKCFEIGKDFSTDDGVLLRSITKEYLETLLNRVFFNEVFEVEVNQFYLRVMQKSTKDYEKYMVSHFELIEDLWKVLNISSEPIFRISIKKVDELYYSNLDTMKEKTRERYSLTTSEFSPDSKKLREVNCEHIQRIFQNEGDDWFRTINLDNNIFSVGLRLQIQRECFDTDEKHVIKLCLTGDLVDEVIEVMGMRKRLDNFQYNIFLKIPHHGLSKSKKIFDLGEKSLQFQYAASTSYASKGLPSDDMLECYKKCGLIHKTNFIDAKEYGIIKYSIPIFDREKKIHVECVGNADEYVL